LVFGRRIELALTHRIVRFRSYTKQLQIRLSSLARLSLSAPGQVPRQEVVAMSQAFIPARRRHSIGAPWLGLFAGVLCLTGCATVSSDVDAYYRQMAFNYKEAQEKAKMEFVTLQNESKVMAVTGDMHQLKRAQRRLARIKTWEEKCGKEATRFEKAAEWTEAHFHLPKPAIPDKPPGFEASEDPAVRQATDTTNP
jgi:hypothetical protein